ncbi:class I SAM-dependent methyltransferase [Candidatus Mycobacterium wuenschmannii]|uniref:Class I SAM-dependent methyltransferase n=1 Tax=Candidatus Mycobacterium wuenschmannii TaxID=3027808 RepID=A0ABY8VYJ4_9MYCO|nr:class I SAM-dependent methyltransferase [Candidatus Mycobacterium wuenschmannii]WIM88710.1 class I SAM-dependent methyltransferase [Candidatus Mycobacterium wuenschmannii]
MPRVITTLRQKTDYGRWADSRNIFASWESRSQRAAALVPVDSRVIEFGAGNRIFERHLHESCTYTPSDIVERGTGTIVCDLNVRPLPALAIDAYDVAVLMGVLEYMRDMPTVLDWLAELVPTIVLSYACARGGRYSPRRAAGSVGRLRAGWLNSYCEDEFRLMFSQRGFRGLHEEIWHGQRLFVFSRLP